jgi:hypothetical protein
MVTFKKLNKMSTFDKFQLKTNPFRLTPALSSDELIWAGFPDVKGKIENRIKRSIQIPNSSLIVNWGEYGSGKTHAARYFNKISVLKELAGTAPLPFSLDISFPKSKEPIKEIFTQVIDKLDIPELQKQIEEKGVNLSDALLATDNIFIRNALNLMFNKENSLFNSESSATAFKGYLYGTADLKKYAEKGVQRKFSTDNDYTEFLAVLFSLLTYQKKAYSCVILWIDEFEDISILSSVNINVVNNFLRTIIDKAPNNLFIYINLTQSAMMNVEDLGEYLQEAVKSRIKDRIELRMPDNNELKQYLKELLNNPNYRTAERDDFSPFDEDVIDEIIKDLGNVSLRRYNEAFSLLLENAVFDNKDAIDIDYYKSIKDEIIGWR